MDARLKFRHLRPADLAVVKAKIEQVAKDEVELGEKLSCLAKSRLEMHSSQMNRTHFVIWLDAWRKLQDTSRNILADLKAHVYGNPELNNIAWDASNSTLTKLVRDQEESMNNFVEDAIIPLEVIRADIRKSLNSNESLRASIRDASASIDAESFKLMQALSEVDDFPMTSRMDTFKKLKENKENAVGIPPEAWEWETHDELFRADLLSEFVYLDGTFMLRLEAAKKELLALEDTYCVNAWGREAFLMVEFIWDIYNASDTPRRRQNCIDFLQRMPGMGSKKPFGQLLDLFREHDVLKMKLEDIVLSWSRARQELADRIHVTLEDAIEERKKRGEEKASKDRWIQMCQQLKDKVQKWRKDRAELEELEFRAKAAEREEIAAKEAEKQARESKRRQEIKTMIKTLRETQQKAKAAYEAAEKLRLEELRRVLDKQRRRDTRRLVEIAKERLHQQTMRRLEVSEEAARQAEAAEARLEALRVKVRPELPNDPFRLFANTESWCRYLEATAVIPEEVETQDLLKIANLPDKPITTFTEDQLQRDRRTRLSTALFEAGLLNSNYARNLLAQVPLPRAQPSLLQVSPLDKPPRPSRKPPASYPKTDIFHTSQDS